MAQKTIVIGMGSTGKSVVDRLVERIEADYGELSRLPWLQMLVFETEQLGGDPLERKNIATHFGIDTNEWQRMKQSPEQYQPTLRFQEWVDQDIMKSAKAPIEGAGGVRLSGRLCLLESNNFKTFYDKVKGAYDTLNALTSAEATAAHSIARPNTVVSFNRSANSSQDLIRVYVVGTLAGGTASGSFIDIGFLLRSLEGVSEFLQTVGIVTIPNAGYTGAIQWGNAIAALTELNHFHAAGSTYTARYPDRGAFPNDIVWKNETPYQNICVVQPRSGGKKGDPLAQLSDSMAEIIFLTVMTDGSSDVDARMIDAYSQFDGETDRKGRPMGFATVGASVVIFPVEHILSGCTALLGAKAFEAVLQDRKPDEYEVKGFIKDNLQVEESTYQNLILKHSKIESYLEQLGQRASQAAEAALRGDASGLSDIHVKVFGNQAEATTGTNWNYQGEFRKPIMDVAEELADRIQRKFASDLAEMVRDPQRGARWTLSLLDDIVKYANKRLSELEKQNTEVGVGAEAKSTLESLNASQKSLDNPPKPGCNPFGKGKYQQELAEAKRRYLHSSRNAWEAWIRVNSQPFEKEVLEKIRRHTEIYVGRLRHQENGLIQFMEKIASDLRDEYVKRNQRAPEVNGLALFTENSTVNTEYGRFIPSDDRGLESRLAAEVRAQRSDWFSDLVKDRDKSPYDKKRLPTHEELELVQRAARPPFERLMEETVEERLVAWPNWQQELADVANLGRSFVTPNANDNPYGVPKQPERPRRTTVAYFHGKSATGNSDAGRVAAELKDKPYNVSEFSDRHRILFYDGLAIFALASIPGIENRASSVERKRLTRMDIAWKNLDGTPLDKQQAFHIGLILVGAAIGVITPNTQGPLIFPTPKTAINPARDFPLDRELADASYHLSRDEFAVQSLEEQVRAKIESMSLSAAAEAIDRFNETAEHRGLTINGNSINKSDAFSRVLPFVGTVPGLQPEVVKAGGALPNPSLESFLRAGLRNAPAAYRCPRCLSFLAGEGDSITISNIPTLCPNPSCQHRLKYDDLVGFTPTP